MWRSSRVFIPAVVASGLVAWVAVAHAAPHLPGAPTATRVVREVDHQLHTVNVGPKGDSLGDQVVFSGTLSEAGQVVGRIGGFFETVQAGQGHLFEVTLTARFSQGQIAAQGLVSLASTTVGHTYVLAIVGGTKAYSGAGGTVAIKTLPHAGTSEDTFQIS